MPDWLSELGIKPAVPLRVEGMARPVIEADEGWGAPKKAAYSRTALIRACEAIESAPWGQQEATLACESFSIGTLIGAGLMPRSVAITCLTNSGCSMPSQPGRQPWTERAIAEKVLRSVRNGEQHPRNLRHERPAVSPPRSALHNLLETNEQQPDFLTYHQPVGHSKSHIDRTP